MKSSSVKLHVENSKMTSFGGEPNAVSEQRVSIDDKEETISAKSHTKCEFEDSDDDADDKPLSVRLKEMPSTTMPVKRTLEDDDSLLLSVKKPKVSYDFDDDYDHIPLLQRIKMKRECGKIQSNEGPNSEVEAVGEQPKLELRLEEEENDVDIKSKKVPITVLEDFIGRSERGLKTKKMEYKRVSDNLDKDRRRKEGELKVLLEKIAECTKELKIKEVELDAKKKLIDQQAKKLESESKSLFNIMSLRTSLSAKVKELEITINQHDATKEIESKEKQFEASVKEFEFKEKEFEGRLKELELKEKQVEKQVKEHKLKEKHFEAQVKKLESEKKQFDRQVKEFELKEKQYEEQMKELKLKQKYIEELKDLELKEKQCEASIKSSEEEQVFDNELCPSINNGSLWFLSNEETVELESLGVEILRNLENSSDPSKIVLDIIQNPIAPECWKGDNSVIIDSSHIILLEQLMRISPNIIPQVRDKAMKLAVDLKSNMRPSAESSFVVLAFLLLLSIYGLVSSFDEDEVLKLFEFAAWHNQSVELFRTLGFADKVSDFVENLIQKQQCIEAVRFVCAYGLAEKYKSVDVLLEYVQNTKQISESCCEETTSIEIKDKAIDQEIATLGTVVECISENNNLRIYSMRFKIAFLS